MSQHSFSVTDSAIAKIKELLQAESPEAKLRVGVLGGGCSGFRYEYTFDTSMLNGDLLYCDLVVIDDVSLGLLENSVLDYHEDLGQAGFVIKNPNAVAKCGCGNSFAV